MLSIKIVGLIHSYVFVSTMKISRNIMQNVVMTSYIAPPVVNVHANFSICMCVRYSLNLCVSLAATVHTLCYVITYSEVCISDVLLPVIMYRL